MRPAHAFQLESARGQSLVQVMVAVGIMFVVAASVIPQLNSGSRSLKLMSLARELEGQLQNARFTAINKNSSASVILNSGGSWYFLDADGNGSINGAETSMWAPSGGYVINSSAASPPLTSSVLGTSTNPASLPNGGVAFTNRGTVVQINSSLLPTTTKLSSPGVIYVRDPSGNYAAVTITSAGKIKSWALKGTTWRSW